MLMKKVLSILALLLVAATGAWAQSYNVTVKEGTDDAANWSTTSNPATAGQTVTIKYNGSKKVKSIKAVKKAAVPSLNLTNPAVGQVIGSDGKNYAAGATLPSGVDKVAMIAYVNGSNGLAIALADEEYAAWATAKSTCEAKTPAFTGGTWKLPTQDEWNQMFRANGGSEESYTDLNTALATAGGTALQKNDSYWSSTQVDEGLAWLVYLKGKGGAASWDSSIKVTEYLVRACLAF